MFGGVDGRSIVEPHGWWYFGLYFNGFFEKRFSGFSSFLCGYSNKSTFFGYQMYEGEEFSKWYGVLFDHTV